MASAVRNHVAVNSRRWWLVLGALAVAVTGALVWLSTSADALDQGDKLASVTGAVLALAALVVTVVLGRARPRTGPDEAAEDLARLVTRQWEREAGARGLTRQEPLHVRWASTERPVAPSAAEVIGAMSQARPTRLKLHGDITALAGALHRLPGRQLVVLGEPGSGKTSAAILVTLSLLAQRRAGEPVPVLLSLASWDPDEQDLETWIAHRISVDHPAFRKRGVHGPEAARALVERGSVLPVLDALDEVARKVAAVKGIARMVGRDKPLVLTCRTDDYEEIIRATGVPVGRAAVVELRPIDAEEAARYLESNTTDAPRWKPLSQAVRENPDGPLARALSTPLAVYLAKTAFTPPGTDPAELLALQTASAVEQHLLDAYLPSLYPDPRDARRWFSYLAHRLAVSPTAGNLAWWRLFLLLPRFHVVVPATRWAVAVGVLGLVTGGFLVGGWTLALWGLGFAAAGAVFGALVGLVLSARTPIPSPRYLVMGKGSRFVWPLSGAWVNFTVARFWFAISGRLPWRLTDFLDDAHARGVLRQVGAAYEFRHQRLQQYFTR